MTDQRRANGRPRSRRAGGRRNAPTRGGSRTGAAKPNKNIEPLHPTLEPPDIESFAEFDLGDEIQASIAGMGISKPTPIQALAIQPVLGGKDVIAKAETGTGKTLAFGAPMMAKIDPSRSTVLGVVLSPTRELAEQVHDVLEKLGEARGVRTTLIVGGEEMGPQVRALQAGAQVVVGTPGRVLDLLNQRFLQFPWTEFAVLDEADKMLEIGFIDDVKKILDACNEYRQTLLFSATFPPPLLELARGYTTDPAEIATASGVATVETIHQYYLRCSEEDRARELSHLIEDSGPDDVFLVFCERRTDVDQLMRKLERRRFSVKALHGGYDQAARFRVMGAFRTGEVKCLVATDVASRGLDVKHVTHVVNLGVPRDVSDYTHRIGRTGRAGADGVAVTFVSRRAERDFQNLKRQSGFDLQEIDRPRDLYTIERKRRRLAARRAEEEDRDEQETPRERKRRDEPRRDEAEREERPRRRRRRSEEERGSEKETREPRRERTRERSREDDSQEAEAPRRPRRRRREATSERAERPERPERSERSERSERPEPRRRSERREREEVPREDDPQPVQKGTSRSDSDGFGAGLTPDETGDRTEGRPKRKRRPRRDRSDGDDGAKARSGRPKGEGRRDDVRPSEDNDRTEAPAKGGFGAGL
ncbi:MAG: DEAD/DEAH box helicase [Planctomycetota bacterium]